MLKHLKLTNFRSHENLEVRFTPGLNTLLGRSEAGKSTILESISYAMLGSDMLRESATEVVTYDKPLNSMRVDLLLEIDGVDYTIYRTPASAEITYADQIVTGQRATKQFMERLLGCDTALFKLLIFAAQESVKGVIASDQKSAAGTLVEKLADLEVIDHIVDRIQTHLPSGNTKVLIGQLDQLRANLGSAPDLPKKEANLEALEELKWASAQLEKLQPKSAQNATTLIALRTDLARAAEASFSKKKALVKQAELQTQAKVPTLLAFSEADLEAARKLAYDAVGAARMRKAYAVKFPTHEQVWDESPASFYAEKARLEEEAKAFVAKRAKLREERIAVAATAVNEDVCSFCKLDISQLPEVAAQNAKVQEQTASIDELLANLAKLEADNKATLQVMDELHKVTLTCKALADPEYWQLSDTVPPVATWVGGPVPAESEVPNIKLMEAQLAAYQKACTLADSAQKQLDELVIPEAPDTATIEASIAALEAEQAEVKAVEERQAKAQQALKLADVEFASAMKVYDFQVANFAQQEANIAKLTADIDVAEKHNALIKKLRDTRPAIAAELWAIVLGGISHYFTQMRGTESVVTRDNDGFKVNGRSVTGLSGSTQDALGLAVRVALTKTFLPNVPLLVLDEPFHGCDKARELAGLGLLASTGFEQSLLVTHSDLADSLSDNLLTL